MNERIKESLMQAGIYDGREGLYWCSKEHLEKFAELIVGECDRYVAEQYDESEPWMQPGDLLKHFGVKE